MYYEHYYKQNVNNWSLYFGPNLFYHWCKLAFLIAVVVGGGVKIIITSENIEFDFHYPVLWEIKSK